MTTGATPGTAPETTAIRPGRRGGRATRPLPDRLPGAVVGEQLEPRRLLSTSFPNIDISHRDGNEAEGVIVADPTAPGRLFAASNTDVGAAGLFAARSTDGGATWTGGIIADRADEIPDACCDPTAAFDSFGNLFLAYINSDQDRVEVVMSPDGGKTFTPLTHFAGDVDQPTLTTGPGSLWITFDKGNHVVVAGAAVTALGRVEDFGPLRTVPGSAGGAFGDIAIGPDGQVAVTYQRGGAGKSRILVNVDGDGLGPAAFGKAVTATTTRVGLFDDVPAQSARGIDAEAGLAYDRSGGSFRGRLYLLYTDAAPRSRVNTDLFLRYSDDGGRTWASPARVNDDTGLAAQVLPRIATDPQTGDVAVSWYDSRDDPGNAAAAATPGASNTGTAALARRAKHAEKHATRQGHASAERDGRAPRRKVAAKFAADGTRRESREGRENEEHHNPRDTSGGDSGAPQPSITPEAMANDDVAYYAALAIPSPAGVVISANARVSDGLSNAQNANNNIDLGDYTGLEFSGGTLLPFWADNSDSTGQNPSGARKDLDMYVARINAEAMPQPSRLFLAGLGGGSGPTAVLSVKGYTTAKPNGRLPFKVVYASGTSGAGVDPASLDGTELLVTGPNGFSQPAQLLKAKPARGQQTVTASYVLTNPGGGWDAADSGVYTISLANDRPKDLAGNAATAGAIGNFVVDVA